MTLHLIKNWTTSSYPLKESGWSVDFGKTKLIYPHKNDVVRILHRDVITANDNPIYTGHAEGKGVTSAYSTALLYKRIAERGVPTAHLGMHAANMTLDKQLDMLPFEVIWRRYNAKGNSWTKRNPESKYAEGERYDEIIYEACLKWSVRLADGSVVHDPFLVLDENFQPLLRPDGMPRLSKGKELDYGEVIHPNKGEEMPSDQVREAIGQFAQHATNIRGMMGIIQQTTFDTYAEIGRLNADGKVEFWLDSKGKLTLGDECELDSLRNISLISGLTDDSSEEFNFGQDVLGQDLSAVLMRAAGSVSHILKAHHSGKQVYRELMKGVDKHMTDIERLQGATMSSEHIAAVRGRMNNVMAQHVTDTVYVPTAMALSDRFGKQAGLVLSY